MAEVVRNGLDVAVFQEWLWTDTLTIAQTLEQQGCFKLQCLIRDCNGPNNLRGHRALDDTIALKYVILAIAERMGMSLHQLLAQFAMRLDMESTWAHLSVLMNV